ncbi:cyclin-dependent kinase 2-interacting protein-like [Homalodisca vitripennis]|uniref:cyclin-dependent kinase 2-interacting protein-like n=1 Tax=Homalodisca vitripennis TaxID=197043 RepID=UPI001EEA2EAC|nr:cyclin-dependent kinase 2-interacting protein-like [Homalodisca vitripennis]
MNKDTFNRKRVKCPPGLASRVGRDIFIGHQGWTSDLTGKSNEYLSELRTEMVVATRVGHPTSEDKVKRSLLTWRGISGVHWSKVVERMLTTKTEVGGVVKLETLRNSSDSPMFLTWPADRFDETWSMITNAYETELALKIYIKENVAHTTTEANLMFLLAAWAHQPYVETSVDVALEALLKETGHR